MKLQRKIQAAANVMCIQADRLLRGADIVGSNKFERLDIDAFGGNPERRRHIDSQWNIRSAPERMLHESLRLPVALFSGVPLEPIYWTPFISGCRACRLCSL